MLVVSLFILSHLLSPSWCDESKELSRLQRLFQNIDTNADKSVSREELIKWLTAVKLRLNNAGEWVDNYTFYFQIYIPSIN